MRLIDNLISERNAKVRASYWEMQINLAYNSNKIEGSTISKNQTRYIFEDNIIITDEVGVKVNDIIETRNHFKAFDYILDICDEELSENHIKKIHKILKTGIIGIDEERFPIGEYKKEDNVIGFINEVLTTKAENVHDEISNLLADYNNKNEITIEDVVEFHYLFERIHPFYDGNGIVGRLIAVKECLRNDLIPPVILDDYRRFYILGLEEFSKGRKQRLIETFRAGQDFAESILLKYR